ncbi:MAG: hypothetical protein RL398_2219 [Planctomycetota bacterium]
MLRAVLAACALLPTVAAQASGAPSPWSERVFPAGVQQTQATSLGKLVAYREGGSLHVYSATTRKWTATSATPAATVWLTNDCLLVQDAGTWSAFAAATGRFAPLSVSPAAQLLNPSNQNNDAILLVQDGAQLHAFSGFVGVWSSRAIGVGAATAVGRNVALLHDGGTVAAMDAFDGVWRALAAPVSQPTLSADGSVGSVVDGTTVHAYSANRGTWASAPLPPATAFARDDDWAAWFSPTEILAYSGQRGRFEATPLGATALAASEDHFGVFATNIGYVPFSAVRAAFGPPLGPTTATLRTDSTVALCTDAATAVGYSPLQNVVAAVTCNNAQESVAGAVALVEQPLGGGWLAFSALTAQWYPTPNDVTATAPTLATTGALFATATGLRAFSARTGNFVPLATVGATPVANPSSAILAAYDAAELHAFDLRTDRWRSVARVGGPQPPVVQVWRTTLQATDGSQAYGFGAAAGTWATTALPEAFATGRANSESGRLLTNTRVLAFSSLGELVGWQQFPFFRRVMTGGSTATFRLALSPADAALVAIGWAAGPQPVPGFGEALFDPVGAAVAVVMPLAGSDTAALAVPLPDHPALVGAELALQPLLLRSGAAPYLGEATILSVW